MSNLFVTKFVRNSKNCIFANDMDVEAGELNDVMRLLFLGGKMAPTQIDACNRGGKVIIIPNAFQFYFILLCGCFDLEVSFRIG